MDDDKLSIHIDAAHKRPDLPDYQEDKCPKCNVDAETGFGLAGGGYGVYSYCPQCGELLSKSEVED